MAWREEYNFAAWTTYAWTSRASDERYSPWQLLCAGEALKLGHVEVPLAALRVPKVLCGVPRRGRAPPNGAARLRMSAGGPFIKLLVALKTRFWPYRCQRTTLL